jgi:hypothetical protein
MVQVPAAIKHYLLYAFGESALGDGGAYPLRCLNVPASSAAELIFGCGR